MGNKLSICSRKDYKGVSAPSQGKENEKSEDTKEDKKNIDDIKEKENIKKDKERKSKMHKEGKSEEHRATSKNEAENKTSPKSKKDKIKEDKKNIDDIKKEGKVKKDKECKSMKQKKKEREILEDTNTRNEMSWERVIEIFDRKNPDTKDILEARDRALKLSKDALKEKEELVKHSKNLWSTGRQARDTQERLIMKLKKAKSEWKTLKDKSDKHSGKKYQEATEEARKKYKKVKNDMKTAKDIGDETLESFLTLQNTIAEYEKTYNQRIQKINASVARLQEREKEALSMTKERISQEDNILQKIAKLEDEHKDIMNEALQAAEDAKQKFINMEDKIVGAREEYDKDIEKIRSRKKMLLELNKFKGLTEFKDTDSKEKFLKKFEETFKNKEEILKSDIMVYFAFA